MGSLYILVVTRVEAFSYSPGGIRTAAVRTTARPPLRSQSRVITTRPTEEMTQDADTRALGRRPRPVDPFLPADLGGRRARRRDRAAPHRLARPPRTVARHGRRRPLRRLTDRHARPPLRLG